MMQIQAKEYASGAEMMADVRSLRYLHVAPRRKPASTPVEPPPAPLPTPVALSCRFAKDMPAWKREATNFDNHVLSWQAHNAFQARNSHLYVTIRAEQLGFTWKQMQTGGRRRKLAFARQILMWEVRTKFGKSFPQIGRMFGGFDHTTCLYACHKIEALKAEGKI